MYEAYGPVIFEKEYHYYERAELYTSNNPIVVTKKINTKPTDTIYTNSQISIHLYIKRLSVNTKTASNTTLI